MVQSPSWKANWLAFHGTRRFITALTRVHHLSQSWASPIQSTYPHPTSWRSIPISPTHLRLGLPSGLLPSGFPTKTIYAPHSLPICATCPWLYSHIVCMSQWRGYLGFLSQVKHVKKTTYSCNMWIKLSNERKFCSKNTILLTNLYQ